MFVRLDKIAIPRNGQRIEERGWVEYDLGTEKHRMHIRSQLYQPCLALLTDLYQLTMAYS
jgi:hypothetical protein